VALSDILSKKLLPRELEEDISLYIGCTPGTSLVEEDKRYLRHAGFEDRAL
jgi:hypothetical protein